MCDAQAGFESLLSALPAALAGANLIYGSGMVDSGMTLDYGKLLMDDEINQNILYLLKGLAVTEETLSVDLIREVGHAGNFLTHPSTYAHFRDVPAPRLMNRENYEQWRLNGASDLHARALAKARDIAEHHQPAPISDQAQKEIDEIIRETEKEYSVIS